MASYARLRMAETLCPAIMVTAAQHLMGQTVIFLSPTMASHTISALRTARRRMEMDGVPPRSTAKAMPRSGNAAGTTVIYQVRQNLLVKIEHILTF